MKQEEMDKLLTRQAYSNFWHEDLTKAVSSAPAYCCYATCCPYCVSYQLRRRALYGDMTRYECCGGYMPCSGKCQEKSCPEFCLGMEAWCCYVSSVMSTRWMLQDEFMIQTTKCDNCLIDFMFILQQLACICSLLACLTGSDELQDLAECLRCVSDVVTCTVTSLMQTQHKIEMDKRDGLIDPTQAMGAPPVQQMTRNDGPVFASPDQGMSAQPVPYGYPAGNPYPPAYPYPPPGPPYSQGAPYPPPPQGAPYPPPPPGQMYPPDPPQMYPPQVYPPAPYPPPGYNGEPYPPPNQGPGPNNPPGPQKM